MKLSYRDIDPFLKNPDPAARLILVYGPDSGLVSERAEMIGKTIVADLSDPFNVVTFTADELTEDTARLSDEANAMSMMGGDRLIRIREGADKLTVMLKDYLENPSDANLIVVEADNLGPRSSLRLLCEKAKNAAALPCYVEDQRDLGRLIRESLQAEGLQIEMDAANWLSANISGDRRKVRSEIEKLILYKGPDKSQISLGDVQACCGEAGAQSLDDLIYGAGGSDAAGALRAYTTLLEEGVPFIVILRALQRHFRRLHITKARIEAGEAPDRALKMLSPPIFFKQQSQFQSQLGRWSLGGMSRTLSKLSELEAQCKKTGTPVETVCAQAILSISAAAR